MFRAHVIIIRRSKLCYTASGTITPIGEVYVVGYLYIVDRKLLKKILPMKPQGKT